MAFYQSTTYFQLSRGKKILSDQIPFFDNFFSATQFFWVSCAKLAGLEKQEKEKFRFFVFFRRKIKLMRKKEIDLKKFPKNLAHLEAFESPRIFFFL